MQRIRKAKKRRMASPEKVDEKPNQTNHRTASQSYNVQANRVYTGDVHMYHSSQSCNITTENFVAGDLHLHQHPGPDQANALACKAAECSSDSINILKEAIYQAAKKKCGEKLLPVYKCAGDIVPPIYKDIQLQNFSRKAATVKLENVFEEAKRNAEQQSVNYCLTKEAKQDFIQKHKNVVMLVGPAGIGKTTAIKHLGTKILDKHVSSDVKWVFYIDCKQIDHETKTTIFHFLLAESGCRNECEISSENGAAALKGLIETSGAGCLILLDGLEEIGAAKLSQVKDKRYSTEDTHKAAEHIFCLLTGRFLKYAKKLCTARKSTAEVLRKRIQFPTVLASLGFSMNDQDDIGKAMCPEKWFNVKARLDQNAYLREICKVPFVCIVVMHCLELSLEDEQNAVNLRTVTGILIYAMECCVNKLENGTDRNELDKLCAFAWSKFTNRKDGFESFGIGDGLKSIFMRSEETRIGFICKTDFYHILWQHFFAALHAVTKLTIDEFREFFRLRNMLDTDKESFTCFLFGLCNETNLALSLCTKSIPNKCKEWSGKRGILRDRAVEAAEFAKGSHCYSKRIHTLFQVGGWLKETTDDNLLREVDNYVPKTVTLADKVYPSDVNALMHLFKLDISERQLDVGIMSSPRFQGDSLLLLFHSVSLMRKLFLSSVDLRGNIVDDKLAEKISMCVKKIDSINLASTEITERGAEMIWKKIALREKPMKFFALYNVKNWGNPMSESTLLAFKEAVLKMKELCFSVNDISDEDLMKVAKAVGRRNSSIKSLDIGVPRLSCETAAELAKCIDTVDHFHLRGCSPEKQSEGAVCELLSGLSGRKNQVTTVFLDHISVSREDIALLSKSLDKISDLVVMYCGVDSNGFKILKTEYEKLPQPNLLRVYLGDVEGVGNSVSLE